MRNVLFWTPRVLMIIFILFISLFALDVFKGDKSGLSKIGSFLIHLIPSAILTVLLILSWRREWIGGIIFFVLGIFYIIIAWGKFPLITYISISGPLFLISILFIINWLSREKPENNSDHLLDQQ